MKEDGAHPQQGGGGPTGVQILFYGRGTGGNALWIGDLGGPPPHGQGPGGVSGPGGKTADRTAPAEGTGREVDIHLGSDSTGEGKVLEGGGIHKAAPEHNRIAYCYTITVRPV